MLQVRTGDAWYSVEGYAYCRIQIERYIEIQRWEIPWPAWFIIRPIQTIAFIYRSVKELVEVVHARPMLWYWKTKSSVLAHGWITKQPHVSRQPCTLLACACTRAYADGLMGSMVTEEISFAPFKNDWLYRLFLRQVQLALRSLFAL